MVKKILFYLMVFLCSTSFAQAQNGTLKGSIIDGDGLALIGANVVIKGTTIGSITDIDGNYTINNVPVGQ